MRSNKFKYTLTKSHLVDNLVQKTSLQEEEAQKVVDIIIAQMTESLVSGARIEFREFGIFEPKMLCALVGRNPLKPKETCLIPERRTVTFHPSKKFRDRLNGKDKKTTGTYIDS